MGPVIDLRRPSGQVVVAVLLAVGSTVLLLTAEPGGTSRRLNIPYEVLVPLGYVLAALLFLNAARLRRRTGGSRRPG